MVRFAAEVAEPIPLPVFTLRVPFVGGFGDLPTNRAFRSGPSTTEHADSAPGSYAQKAAPRDTLEADRVETDRLEELSEEITSLASQIHAATYRLLTLLAEFDDKRGWEREGHRSCAHWLSYRTGIDLGASRERVRAARALVDLPQIGSAMAKGELSFSKVRALTRVATPEDEEEMLNFALESTTGTLERAVRGWKRRNRAEEGEWERERHESRTLSVFPDDDGMVVIRGKLDPEVGALLMRAIEAASDALYRRNTRGDAARRAMIGREKSEREAAQRRADAMGLLAERAMAAGFGGDCDEESVEGGNGNDRGMGGEEEEGAARRGGTAVRMTNPTSIPVSGTRAERYQVVLHVEATTLTGDGEPGRSEVEGVSHVSAETSRRISCDCGVICVTHRQGETEGAGTKARSEIGHRIGGEILSVGRRTRTISPALRRALEIRDRGCRFPGCGLRFTDAHHVRHWADGGETSLENCLLLCRYHHRLIHEGGWTVGWWGTGRPVFHDPRGGTHFDRRRGGTHLDACREGSAKAACVRRDGK